MEIANEGPGAENYLLYWRKRRNLSLTALSTRIAATGSQFVSAKTLNRWEKGETPLSEWAIADVAKALKVSEEELLHGPREADPHLPVNVSGAYTGLDLEIAERVITMGYTSWFASRPESARSAVQSIVPWLETLQRRAVHAPQAREGVRQRPQMFSRLQLRGMRRQEQQMDTLGYAHLRAGMPTRAVEHQHDLLGWTRANLAGKRLQLDGEEFTVHGRRQMPHGATRGRMHETDEVAPVVPMFDGGNWALTG